MKKVIYSFILIALLLAGTHCRGQVITTIIGRGTPGFMADGSAATSGTISHPSCIAVDDDGNIYYGDYGYARVRRVNRAGIINTFAGNGVFSYTGDGGPATAASLFEILSVAVDASHNVYIADGHSRVVRKVDPSGIITTYAGNGISGYSGDGGPATAAQLSLPTSVAVDGAGNVYIADGSNQVIRKVDATGVISTFAGNNIAGFSGDGGPATAAQLHLPTAVATDHSGNVYIADAGNYVIRKVNAAGIISTVAGIGVDGYTGDGGPATSASISYVEGINTDVMGNLFIAEKFSHVIRKVNAAGIISTVAGNGFGAGGGTASGSFTGDGGQATAAGLNMPGDVALDAIGNMYISDYYNDAVRKVSGISGTTHICTGNVTTFNAAVAGGVWASSMPGVADVGTSSGLVTGIAAGTAIIYYSIGTDTARTTVYVDAAPTAGTITAPDSMCAGTSITLADPAPGGIWSLSNGNAHNIGGIITADLPGLDTVRYSINYTCGTATAQHVITIAQPDAGTVVGPHSICVGDTVAFTDSAPGGIWITFDTANAIMIAPGVVKAKSIGPGNINYLVLTTIPTCSALATFNFSVVFNLSCGPDAVANTVLHTGETRIYPNPATGTVNVEMAAINEARNITISDMLGRTMLTATAQPNATKAEVNLHLPPGTYTLSVHSSTATNVHKLVVE